MAGLKIRQSRKENANEELGDALKTMPSKPRSKCLKKQGQRVIEVERIRRIVAIRQIFRRLG